MEYGFNLDMFGDEGLEMLESITDSDLEVAKNYADEMEE